MNVVIGLSILVADPSPSALAQVFARLAEVAPDAKVRTVAVEADRPLLPGRDLHPVPGYGAPTAPIPVPDA